MRWYYGEPSAANERWAFAFSAKKKWREKVKSDVESIISTDRPYVRIFFITNQYAPEKSRSSAEDSLTKLAGIPVTILDRSWILEKVYANNWLELTIRTLNMTGFASLITERIGPRDSARIAELERLDAAVADTTRYGGARYALVEDALESALLARGLERSRHEVEGRFQAAKRIADDVGHIGQRRRIAYNHAWTAFWWFNDPTQFNKLYIEFADLALKSELASDLDDLHALWTLLLPTVVRNKLSAQSAQIKARGDRLRDALGRLASQADRPNNAAQARTTLLTIEVNKLILAKKHDDLIPVWASLREVIAGVDRLSDYPVERIHEYFTRLGEFVPETQDFDDFYEDLVGLFEKRRSEAEGGIAYLRRGSQKLAKGCHYDAIRMLGRAETRLIKAEYIDELVQTLVAIGQSYKEAGLLYAARAKLLVAADRLLLQFGRAGRLDPRTSVPLKHLVWIEIELGRVPQVLAFGELYRLILKTTEQPEEIVKHLPEILQTQEAILGMLLMRTDLSELRELEYMPAALDKQGLYLAGGAMVWALSDASTVRKEGYAPADQTDVEISEFYNLWIKQPAAEQIPEHPIFNHGGEVFLTSIVLGVKIKARVACNHDSILLSEAILASLESFLSTSLSAEVFPYREEWEFTVQPSLNATSTPAFQLNDQAQVTGITHGGGNLAGSADHQAYLNWLQELIVHISLSILVIRDADQWLERVARDEAGFGRALALCGIATATQNILGERPRILLSDWLDRSQNRVPLTRKAAVIERDSTDLQAIKTSELVQFGEAEPPGNFDAEGKKHTEIQVLSPINLPLCDNAKWRATGYVSMDAESPPFLLVGFENYEAGENIFLEWRNRYGFTDERDEPRVSIIKGVDRANSAHYTLSFSSNFKLGLQSDKHFYLVSRHLRMTPNDTINLNNFLRSYLKCKSFIMAPYALGREIDFDSLHTVPSIRKRTLVVREAWTIGVNDPEMICLNVDDVPIIPDNVADAPIYRTLERLRRTRDNK